MQPVIDKPEELSAAWLSTVLQESGRSVIVRDVRRERIGSGQMGITYRLHLSYEGPDGPSTLIAKLAGENHETRALVAPGYAAEVGFYSTLAQTLDVRTPGCWHAAISDDHTCFTLLLEDLSPGVPGVQARGCTVEQAAASLRNLVGLHVGCWDDPKLRDIDFLMRPNKDTAAMMAQLVSQASEEFIPRYADELTPEDGETLRRVGSYVERWQLADAAPFSILHGDYRLDNLLFDPVTGDATSVDWQAAAIGPPLRDVAYFLGTSLRSDDRAVHEQSLVRTYYSALLERGISGYSFKDCWKDYRIGQLQGSMITVIGCIYAGTKRTVQSDAMFIAMARRSCAAVREAWNIRPRVSRKSRPPTGGRDIGDGRQNVYDTTERGNLKEYIGFERLAERRLRDAGTRWARTCDGADLWEQGARLHPSWWRSSWRRRVFSFQPGLRQTHRKHRSRIPSRRMGCGRAWGRSAKEDPEEHQPNGV